MCLDFFKGNVECCEPCCGKPCNFVEGLYCCLCWYCCGCFVLPKFYASAQKQECACLNHCVPFLIVYFAGIIPYIGGIISAIVMFAIISATRFNLRKMHGIGDPKCHPCDCLGLWCCVPGYCLWCQEIRSLPKESWDCLNSCKESKYPSACQVEQIGRASCRERV